MRFKILPALLSLLFIFTTTPAMAKDVVLRPLLPSDRVVVVIHGSGGHASEISRAAQRVFLATGFAVAASDADGPQNWGNPASVADYEHLISRLRRVGYTRVFLLAGSMGGLDAMQLIGRVHPEAVEMNSPVCNASRLGIISPTVVELGWGGPPPAYISPVIPEPEKGLPVRIWASPEDTWVPKRWNADVCARELRHRDADVHESATAGNHPEAAPRGGGMLYFFQGVAARRKARDRYADALGVWPRVSADLGYNSGRAGAA